MRLLAATVVALGLIPAAPAVVPTPGPSPAHAAAANADGRTMQHETFLGFELGEERRYVLGPEESLGRDETGMWSIRLEELYRDDDGRPEAVFALRSEWQGPRPLGNPPLRAVLRLRSEGQLRLNAHGFPLFIRFETVRHLAGLGDQAYTIDYGLEEDRRGFEKRTTMDGDRWYQRIPIRAHDIVRRDPPRGLFAFLPDRPDCLDRYIAIYQLPGGVDPQPQSAASPATTPEPPRTVRVVDNEDCEEALFANPGLLDLAMPALWEALGERAYVFFTPLGPTRRPAGGVVVGAPQGGMPMPRPGRFPSAGFPGGIPNATPRVGGDTLSPSTYHELRSLRFRERVTVAVGARTVEAWLIDLDGEIGPVYVDDDGGVVRVDLPPLAEGMERWIRRLWPSEF